MHHGNTHHRPTQDIAFVDALARLASTLDQRVIRSPRTAEADAVGFRFRSAGDSLIAANQTLSSRPSKHGGVILRSPSSTITFGLQAGRPSGRIQRRQAKLNKMKLSPAITHTAPKIHQGRRSFRSRTKIGVRTGTASKAAKQMAKMNADQHHRPAAPHGRSPRR